MKFKNMAKKILPVVLSATMIFTSVPVYADEQASDNITISSVTKDNNLQTISDDTGIGPVTDNAADTEDDVVSANADTNVNETINAVSSTVSEDYANEATESGLDSASDNSLNKSQKHYATGRRPSGIILTDNGSTDSLEAAGATLPSSYTDTSAVTAIKNQEQTDLCWVFSTIKACEADLIKSHKQPKNINLSEKAMAYWFLNQATGSVGNGIDNDYYHIHDNFNTFSPLYQNKSALNTAYMLVPGDEFYATSVLSSWKGLKYDTGADSFTNNISNVTNMCTRETSVPSSAFGAPFHMQNAILVQIDGHEDEVKQMILNYGAVTAGCHLTCVNDAGENIFDPKSVGTDVSDISFYNKYNNGDNHQIAIVGWDDYYLKTNFHGTNGQPSRDGAWLCANSWGTDADHMNNGLFYISYDDATTKNSNAAAYDVATSSDSDWYDNNYQVGGLGMTASAGNGTGLNYYGVLFDASVSNYESLKAISMWTFGTNQSYTIEIYKNPTITDNIMNINNQTPIFTQAETITDCGYHTIALSSPVSLSKGDKFYVQINNPNNYAMALADDNYIGDLSDYDDTTAPGIGYYLGAPQGIEESSGKSYGSYDGNNEVRGGDYCIHAFTDNTTTPTDKPSTISFKSSASSSLTAVNDKADLSALVNFTAGSVSGTATKISSYTSSDTSVVAISGNTATALKAGKATVTVTTSDRITATVAFTITASSPDPTPEPETKIDIDKCSIVGINGSYTYTGNPITITPYITYNASLLNIGSDYTLSSSTDTTNVGEVTVTITGIGKYTGFVTRTFNIAPVFLSNCSISGINNSYSYTGSPIEPSITVKNGNTVMASGTDYSISYSNNTEAGTATVTITGTNNYAGFVTKTFEIIKAETPVNPVNPVNPVVPDNKPKNTDKTVAVARQKIDVASCFTADNIVRYRIDDSEQRKIASVNNKGIVTAKKSGTVTITAYIKDGKNYISAGSYTLTVEKPELKKMSATYLGQTLNANDYISGLSKVSVSRWTSSKASIAAIDENTGLITVTGKGSTKITAEFNDNGTSAKYSVTLKCSIPSINRKNINLQSGARTTLRINNTKVIPKWSVSNASVASIEVQENGLCKVTADKVGTSDIIGSVDGIPYTCTLTVITPEIRKSAITVKVNKTAKVALKKTKLKPSDWKSEDTSIASVDASTGAVTGVKEGTTKIYTMTGGVRNECDVTVTE